MKALTDTQIKKLIEDIATIKEVLNKSKPSLQLLFHPIHFWLQSLIFGISIIIFTTIYIYLISLYGSFQSLPMTYRVVMIIIIIVDLIFIGVLKIRNWIKSVSRVDSNLNFRRIMFDLFFFKLVHGYILFIVCMGFFIIFWVKTGQLYLIIPTISIGVGLILNFIGNLTELSPYIATGSWMLICGFLILSIGTLSGPVAIILSFGIGLIIFPIHTLISFRSVG